MELLVSLVYLGAVFLVACSLPWWLAHGPLYRCLENWLLYRRWTPCRHVRPMFRRVPGSADLYEFACVDCLIPFLVETRARWESGQTRPFVLPPVARRAVPGQKVATPMQVLRRRRWSSSSGEK